MLPSRAIVLPVRGTVAAAFAWAVLAPRVPRRMGTLEAISWALAWGAGIAVAWSALAAGGTGPRRRLAATAALVLSSLLGAHAIFDAGSGVLAAVAASLGGAALGEALGWSASPRPPSRSASAAPVLPLGLVFLAAGAYVGTVWPWALLALALMLGAAWPAGRPPPLDRGHDA
jgi:hypothetical protein